MLSSWNEEERSGRCCPTPATLRAAETRKKNTERRRKNRALERVRAQYANESAAASQESLELRDALLLDRAAAQAAKEIAFNLHTLTRNRGIQYQRTFFNKLLKQTVLQSVLPDYVVDRKDLEHCRVVCDGLAQAWSGLKYGIGRDKKLARNVIEAAVISIDDERSFQAAASVLGMNKRTIRRAKERRGLLNVGANGELWAHLYRKKRKDALPTEVIDCVVSWWEEETRVSPCKKDVRRKRVGVRQFIEHATQWLEESQLDFYTRFRACNHDVVVSFVAFRRLKPYYVKRLRDFNSCCCRYHQEMAEITIGWNNMRSSCVHIAEGDTACSCGCASMCSMPCNSIGAIGLVACQTLAHTYKRSTNLWEKSLCPLQPGLEWHNLSCLKGECIHCGFHKLPICEQELDPTNTAMMRWRRFEQVVAGKTKSGDLKTVVRLEYKETNPRAFLAFAKPKIAQFIFHQFVAKWQDNAFRVCLDNLREGEVMSLIDFAENYSFKGQDEIQSQHWYNFQLTILVHITYSVNREYNPLDSSTKRLCTDYYYYISDDKMHDSLYVQHCLTMHWRSLVAKGAPPRRHVVWSDGCASQFKGAKAWFYVAKYPSMTVSEHLPEGCRMDWHFWGTGHGKGPHDGAGACLKQCIRKEQLRPNSIRLHCADDVVKYLRSAMNLPNAAYPLARRIVHRHFYLIGLTDVPREKSLACQTVPGSRNMHSVRSVSHLNNVLFEYRDHSCFCPSCVFGDSSDCPRSSHAQPWKMETLEPMSNKDAVQEPEEQDPDWEKAEDDNILAANLCVGDHFAVLADPLDPGANGANFFVLICTKVMHIVSAERVQDNWDGMFDRGDEVVHGLYYHQSGRKQNSYRLMQERGPAIHGSHLVIASNFMMTLAPHRQKGGVAVYQLSDAALTHIVEIVKSIRERDDLGDDKGHTDDSDNGEDDGSDMSSDGESEINV